jgi:hypothetical protein
MTAQGPFDIEAVDQPDDSVGLLVEAVIAQFVPDEEQNEEAAYDSDGQTSDVDDGMCFMAH